MKKTRLLLIGVLASLSLAIQAQNYLPQKNSFAFGGGMMWGIGNTKGGFLDKTGNPTCAEFILDYRHYWGGDLAVGATYNFLTGNKNGNSLRCNYIAPTLTYRWLWAENKQGFWATLGIGYLHYKDEIYDNEFKKGHLAMSTSLGYEFALGKGVGMQIRADFIMSDFRYVNSGYYPSIGGNYEYYENWDSALNFLSLGVALMFGK
ncbi:MAG: hypothetical protein IJY95_07840 [Bacteroides sp.]|nr:hypothetical protein [Bacteroides sp.]